jgi:hypothetical protein
MWFLVMMKKISILSFVAFFLGQIVFAKKPILIMTPTSSHPEFIALQYKAFEKCIQDSYEFIVFNDASDPVIARQITDMCAMLNIKCYSVPQEGRQPKQIISPFGYYSWASYRHAHAVEYMMQKAGFDYDGIVVLIDSDMFPVRALNVTNFLGSYDIAGLKNFSYGDSMECFWAGLIFFNMKTLPNKKSMRFLPVETETVRLDSGGSLFQYFRDNPSVTKLIFNQEARFRLDEKLYPYYAYPSYPSKWRYIDCNACQSKKELGFCSGFGPVDDREAYTKCKHKKSIFEEYGFHENMVNMILGHKVPTRSEFILKDTFFHAVASSGYLKRSSQEVKKRVPKIAAFVNEAISLV